ncbi:hypothetical protein AGMMS50239_19440 [Bacteroidia bacterium]|nr:hypothetical protein AGMMS50239_19440 [Bacteroidia bacterium]
MQTQLYAVAFDAGFIHKSGKHTPCTGYFWSGCAGKTLRGLEVLSLSLVDADSRMSFHLKATQTPPANCLSDHELSLPDWYAAVIKKDNLSFVVFHGYKSGADRCQGTPFFNERYESVVSQCFTFTAIFCHVRQSAELSKKSGIFQGTIESANRDVIQKRMKLSGQRWTIQGAKQMLNRRTCYKSDKQQVVEKLIMDYKKVA